MTQLLLEHLGLGPDEFTPVEASYAKIVEGIESGEIDVAIGDSGTAGAGLPPAARSSGRSLVM